MFECRMRKMQSWFSKYYSHYRDMYRVILILQLHLPDGREHCQFNLINVHYSKSFHFIDKLRSFFLKLYRICKFESQSKNTTYCYIIGVLVMDYWKHVLLCSECHDVQLFFSIFLCSSFVRNQFFNWTFLDTIFFYFWILVWGQLIGFDNNLLQINVYVE